MLPISHPHQLLFPSFYHSGLLNGWKVTFLILLKEGSKEIGNIYKINHFHLEQSRTISGGCRNILGQGDRAAARMFPSIVTAQCWFSLCHCLSKSGTYPKPNSQKKIYLRSLTNKTCLDQYKNGVHRIHEHFTNKNRFEYPQNSRETGKNQVSLFYILSEENITAQKKKSIL